MPIYGLISIPIIIAFAHFFGLHRKIHNRKLLLPLRSFSAGFSIGYVFLFVLPETFRINQSSPESSLAWILIGFVIFHAALKFIFRTRNQKRKSYLLDEMHLAVAALYSFLLTFSIVELSKQNQLRSLVLVAVIILHTMLSEISHKEPHKDHLKQWKTPILIFFTLLGGFLSLFDFVSTPTLSALYALASGAIIYITTREEIPSESEGDVTYFIIGALICIISANYIA
ncbi:MAG: hypothetical protein KatS3mg087_0319 [Patescibacteria group bacterium]|nr:MAG: hypothetical protein KatS3mg087_0319 [Patescibacteria group bacterium]